MKSLKPVAGLLALLPLLLSPGAHAQSANTAPSDYDPSPTITLVGTTEGKVKKYLHAQKLAACEATLTRVIAKPEKMDRMAYSGELQARCEAANVPPLPMPERLTWDEYGRQWDRWKANHERKHALALARFAKPLEPPAQ